MKREKPNQVLEDLIQTIFDENNGNHGYRRIHLELRNQGYQLNHKKDLKEVSFGEKHASIVLTKVLLEGCEKPH
ncbi:IS3 family transposase [Oceanobacillus arenosus]